MDCEAIRRQLAAWSDGELDPHSRADVDRHLEDCADCRVDGQGLRELDERCGAHLRRDVWRPTA